GDPAAPGRVQGSRARGDARGADELARVGVQLLLDPADLGRVPEAQAGRERGAARRRRARHDGAARRPRSALDPVHEVHLAADLHLPAERAGVDCAAHRGVLPARRAVAAAEWTRGGHGPRDRPRPRDGPARARAREGSLGERHALYWFATVNFLHFAALLFALCAGILIAVSLA